jgi:hypothetical protein
MALVLEAIDRRCLCQKLQSLDFIYSNSKFKVQPIIHPQFIRGWPEAERISSCRGRVEFGIAALSKPDFHKVKMKKYRINT